MIPNALLITVALMLGIGFLLMDQLMFLIPYKLILWRTYWEVIISFVGALFVNVFAAAFVLNRKFFLKDTGRKLAHLDKQFHVGDVHLPADTDEEERT